MIVIRTGLLVAALAATLTIMACADEDPTPSPEPTPDVAVEPSPMNTPVAAPTPSPTSISVGLPVRPTATIESRNPADYSDEELVQLAQGLIDEFYAAVQAEPEPDLERAKATYSSHCQPDDDAAFEEQIEGLLGLLEGGDLSFEVITVERLSDESFLTFGFANVGGQIARTEPSLMIFEDGQWVDSDCPAGRLAAGYEGGQESSQEEPTEIVGLPTVPDIPHPALSDDPTEHTDEQVLESSKAVINDFLRAMLAQPEPDIATMRGAFTAECASGADEIMAQTAAGFREAFASAGQTAAFFTQDLDRVDGHSALIGATLEIDGVPVIETVPALHVFEDGKWLQAECLT